MNIRGMFLATVALVGLANASAARAETLKVAISQRGFWNSSYIDFGVKQGFFKDEGLDIEPFYTVGGASTLDAVMSGSVDVGMSNGILGVIGRYVKGAPIRVISAEFTGGSDAFWYARADSGVKTLKDTDGKTVAFSSNGSSTNLMLLALLKLAGARARPTATGGAPATYTQVMTKQIDVGWSVPPFGLQDVLDGKLVIVARGSDIPELANQTVRVNITREDVLKSRRDALTRFSRALERSIDWAYADPKALEYYAAENNISVALARKMVEFFPREAARPGEIKGLDLTLRDALAFKYIPEALKPEDVKGMIDILYQPQAR